MKYGVGIAPKTNRVVEFIDGKRKCDEEKRKKWDGEQLRGRNSVRGDGLGRLTKEGISCS